MAEINAKDVMTLRASTGLGMMDCKEALRENNGDLTSAEEWLRVKLKGKMDKRTDRASGEGRIAIVSAGAKAAILELRAETDFTAKNDLFIETADKLAGLAAASGSAGTTKPTDAMTKLTDDARITTGENIHVARAHVLEGGSFGSYVHHDGKTAALLQFEGDLSNDLARDICMHITAALPRPLGVTTDDIPSDAVEEERKLALGQAIDSGKPQEIAEQMVEGKMRKFYAATALLEQPFIKNPDQAIKDLIPAGTTVTSFVRWQLGEGSATEAVEA